MNMLNKKKHTFFQISKIIQKPYKYGFVTHIDNEDFPLGLNKNTIHLISKNKKECDFFKQFRLNAYNKFQTMSFPNWSQLKIKELELNNILYYSAQKEKSNKKSIDTEIFKTFKKLGIILTKKISPKNIAMDAIFDSISITTTYKDKLAKSGVIFCSISEAIQKYPLLVEKYLGSIIPAGDNYFSCLNSAVFTDGSFCYMPKNIKCPLELSSYFRINNQNSGQFERTLIIAEKNSTLNYLEGCTATQYKKNQLHAAIVEIIAFENALIKYSTVQNWYGGDTSGVGGIYNFVTKRGLCVGKNSRISWAQVETGSSITWKYPSCVLLGKNSIGEFYSIALTNNYQQADTGTKMIHIGDKTKSHIISKGISCGHSKNIYRGLVKMSLNAKFSRNYSQCDSFLLGLNSISSTYPYLDVANSNSIIEHEAKISKVSEEQIFYLLQRGINIELAFSLLINGFCKDVLSTLPMEFASEAEKLLSLKLEGSIG